MFQEIGIAALLLLFLSCSLEAGFRIGRRPATGGAERMGGKPPDAGQTGMIQGATLGLLGLLLGFSFAGASSRFLERQDLILQEANAIGTAYLRADVLDDPSRSELRTALARYVEHRIKVSETLRHGITPQALDEVARLHDQIWKAASGGVAAKPAAMVAVLAPVNDVIDLHSNRLAAGRKHLPGMVMALLIACSALSMYAIGYGCGLSGRRGLAMTGTLVIVVAASLWTTIDLDHPRMGLIQLSDLPLKELKLGPGSPAPAASPR